MVGGVVGVFSAGRGGGIEVVIGGGGGLFFIFIVIVDVIVVHIVVVIVFIIIIYDHPFDLNILSCCINKPPIIILINIIPISHTIFITHPFPINLPYIPHKQHLHPQTINHPLRYIQNSILFS